MDWEKGFSCSHDKRRHREHAPIDSGMPLFFAKLPQPALPTILAPRLDICNGWT